MTSAARRPHSALLVVAIICAALATFSATQAEAGLIGTAPASGCSSPSQVFAPWGDSANYVLVPGGSFESGAPAWATSGGARTVAGNEPFHVNSPTDSRSLHLPSGSAAVSPTVCFGFGDWHSRFFVRSVGSGGSLKVDIVVKSVVGGLVSILDGGSVTATGQWSPSPRVRLTLTNVCSLLGVKAVAFRFRTVGENAAFQVDDVYLDPYKEW